MQYITLPKHTCGIYQIRNNVNGKVYIGSSVNVRHRAGRHYHDLIRNKHMSPHLQAAWNHYGPTCFEVTLLETCSREGRLVREQYHLDRTRSYNRENGYNVYCIAGSPRGHKKTDEQRRKIGERLRGKKRTPEQCARISAALRGRKMSPEYCAKMSQIKMGHKQSEENVAKRAKPYSFIDETGTIHQGANLKRFADQYGHHRSNLRMVLKGIRPSHHGLRLYIPPTNLN